ncbi:MAG: DMT family transporter [Firmicutes bacterium]|nr:DMT family transporter [Bacillota bacterium]
MNKKSFILVNAAVLLFGFAGLFARWVSLPALGITFGRVFFSSIALGLYIRLSGGSFKVESRRDLTVLIVSGALLAVHWWSILKSIQLSTVAIGTITFSTFPFFVTFMEPLVLHEKPRAKNVIVALVILAGVIITIPSFSFENDIFRGVLVGMISPVSYSVITILNKGFTRSYSGTLISFYEQATAAAVLLPLALAAGIRPGVRDIGLLIVFGTLTTAFAHTLFINSLKDIPARLAGVCSSMETVYGILFAMILLGEAPSLREILGGAVIMAAVIFAQLTETGEA